jgi:undecaprenyl-diphosphatase
MIAGALVSFLVGLIALRVLIRIVVQRKLHWFAYYCLVLGTAVILWELLAAR